VDEVAMSKRPETLTELRDNFIAALFAVGVVTLGAMIVGALLR
jgi:hypothetical protein